MRDLSKYIKNYEAMPFEESQILYRRKIVLQILNEFKPKNILEVGCGMDSIANYYQDFENFFIIEPGKQFINKAKSDLSFLSTVKFCNNYLEDDIIFLDKIDCDFIIVSSLLHEVEDKNSFLLKLKKISKPGTVIHFNVPNAKSFHRLLALELGLIKNIYEKSEMQSLMQQKSKVFDLQSLENILIKYDFKILNSGSYFIKPFTHSQMKNLIDSSILPLNILDGLDGMIKYLPKFGSEIYVNVINEIRSL